MTCQLSSIAPVPRWSVVACASPFACLWLTTAVGRALAEDETGEHSEETAVFSSAPRLQEPTLSETSFASRSITRAAHTPGSCNRREGRLSGRRQHVGKLHELRRS